MVEEGVTLEIESGTTIRFNESCYLHVKGSLNAVGSNDSMITFTSNKENPTARDWEGIERGSDANIILEHVVIEFASSAIGASISHESGNMEISNSIIENNYIGVDTYYSSPLITYTTIRGNQCGLSCHGVVSKDIAPVINHCNIYNNSAYNIRYTYGDYDMDATNNYWGTVKEDKIDESIYDYYDDYSLGKVIYEPIATDPF